MSGITFSMIGQNYIWEIFYKLVGSYVLAAQYQDPCTFQPYYCKQLLYPACTHQKFPGVDVNSKDPHTVVLLLDSPEVPIVCKACEALHKHMETCKKKLPQ